MKKIMMILLAVAIPAAGLFAQQGKAYGMRNGSKDRDRVMYCQNNLDLSVEQQEQLQSIRMEHLKVVQPNHDQLAILRAELKAAISSGDKAAADKIIDQQSAISKELKKEFVDHQLAVREVLTDDQRVLMDSRKATPGKSGVKNSNRPGRGYGPCQRPGFNK
jgi:Spy/CpxP family protein refolding chaperone